MLMKTDELGIPRFTDRDLIDMIYTGHIDKCHVVLCDPSDDVSKFNKVMLVQVYVCLCVCLFSVCPTPGVNFTNVLQAVFTSDDPKIAIT